jgi:hypothetical protein
LTPTGASKGKGFEDSFDLYTSKSKLVDQKSPKPKILKKMTADYSKSLDTKVKKIISPKVSVKSVNASDNSKSLDTNRSR